MKSLLVIGTEDLKVSVMLQGSRYIWQIVNVVWPVKAKKKPRQLELTKTSVSLTGWKHTSTCGCTLLHCIVLIWIGDCERLRGCIKCRIQTESSNKVPADLRILVFLENNNRKLYWNKACTCCSRRNCCCDSRCSTNNGSGLGGSDCQCSGLWSDDTRTTS